MNNKKQNNLIRLFLFSIIFFISCEFCFVENNDKQSSSNKNSNLENSDFKVFWSNFSQALRINDTVALNQYLDSVVFFLGREDQDPILEFKNNIRIVKVREIYLNDGFYDYKNDVNVSYQDFFFSKKALDNEYVKGKEYQDIKDFVFKKKFNEWKLIGIYTDTKKLKK